MERNEALQFLRNHQPLPSDEDISEEILDFYDQVREYFLAHPDPECIPLILNSFGGVDGYGIYQIMGEVLDKYTLDQVKPHLLNGLNSPSRNIRYWNADIAANFPDSDFVKPLGKLLQDEDPEIRWVSILALAQIDDSRVIPLLKEALKKETEPDVIEQLEETLDDLSE